MTRKTMLYMVPLVLFVLVAVLFIFSLGRDTTLVPSPLIDKPAPSFSLQQLGSEKIVNPVDLYKGKVWMLNVWASWCAACRAEHPVFTKTRQHNPEWLFVGLNYQDNPEDGQAWLDELGDPYTMSLSDIDGRVGIEWGVYGVPETFVIDSNGFIRYKHIGPVSQQLMDEIFLPMLVDLL